MSDISIPGVNSKYGTQQMIESLVKVERNKLVQMETQKKDLEDTKLIWQDANKRMQAVRDAAKTLYGFNNPFGAKLGSSSDEKSLTVAATRQASNGEYEVKVLKQATNDRFLSGSQPLDATLAPGEYRFKVGEKELVINFKGGKLQNFVDAVNLKNPTLLKASVIRDTADSQRLQIEAVPVGAKNALQVSGTALSELTRVGMFGAPSGSQIALSPGTATVVPGAKQSWSLESPLAVTGTQQLQLTLSVGASVAPPAPAQPAGFTYPDGGTVSFEGITLSGSGMQGQVPRPAAPPAPAEVKSLAGLVLKTTGKDIPLGDLPDSADPTVFKVSLPAGQSMTGVEYANGNSARTVSFTKAEVVDPAKAGGPEPKQPVSRAGDAELEFEGVKIVRDKNAVDDVIPGVTLNLVGASKDKVTVKVEPDRKTIKDTVINFLGSYNRLLTEILILTTIKPDNPGASAILQEATYLSDDEKKKAEPRLGKFQGDIGLNQLKNSLQRVMMDPYNTDGGAFNVLAQVGISTNTSAGGSDRVNTSKLRGYMEMDEATFDAAVTKDIDAVKKLFGSSSDGTLIINTGAAYQVDQLLKPSTELGGFNAMRMASLDTQIKAKTKEMSDYNDYLARYQQDLKRKYGQMESTLNAMQKNSQALGNLGNSGN